MLRGVAPVAGWIVVVGSSALYVATVLHLRTRIAPLAVDAFAVLAGAGVGVGGNEVAAGGDQQDVIEGNAVVQNLGVFHSG
jgi:hypothetical protein